MTDLLTYNVLETQDHSVMRQGKQYNRLVLRIAIRGGEPNQTQVDTAMRRAAEAARMPGRFRRAKPDAVMVFAYQEGEDIQQAFTLGRYVHGEWA